MVPIQLKPYSHIVPYLKLNSVRMSLKMLEINIPLEIDRIVRYERVIRSKLMYGLWLCKKKFA